MSAPCFNRWSLPLLIFAVTATPAHAHPGAGIAVDESGCVYFVRGGSRPHNRIMRIDAEGQLTTFFDGGTGKRLSNPHHVMLDEDGNLYSVGDRDSQILKFTPDGNASPVDPRGDSIAKKIGRGGDPFTMDAQENIYGVDYQQHKQCQIVKISPDGRVTSLAGGDWGYADGKGPQAKFRDLHGSAFAWAADGALLITDNGTFVRKVTPEGMVSTLAGGEEAGFMDGSATEARFNGAMGIAVESSGSVYVADSRNRRIRKVSPDGDVSTYAGTGQGREANGLRQKATFENPAGVAVGRDGTVYVLDYVRSDPHVRKITPEGIVTTIAEVD